MAWRHDAVLLIAFGGPDGMDDVRPYLANVLRGRRVPPERVEEVARHYEIFGGRSPLTALTLRQAAALEAHLREGGRAVPVYIGMRNWTPYLHETLERMRVDGVRRAVGIVMAPHRSYASWGQYHENIADARARVGDSAPEVGFVGPWHDHPGFVAAQADRVTAALSAVPAARRREIPLIFTAHSIPLRMARESVYAEEVAASARLVAQRLGHSRWWVAYQSRSGDPRDPWLEPDVGEVLRGLAREGATDAVAVPIGFVCDHIEVLYDLDVEARGAAGEVGIAFHRAGTVMDHPAFIGMLGDLARAQAAV